MSAWQTQAVMISHLAVYKMRLLKKSLSILLSINIIIIYLPANSSFAQEKKVSLFIMDFDIVEGCPVSKETVSQILTARISRLPYFRMLSRQDVNKILQKEELSQYIGQVDNTDRMLELGRRLEVDKLVYGKIGKLGKVYVVTLVMLDTGTNTVEKRISRTVKVRKDLLINVLNEMADNFLAYLIKRYAPYVIKKPERQKDKTAFRLMRYALGGFGVGMITSATAIYIRDGKIDNNLTGIYLIGAGILLVSIMAGD